MNKMLILELLALRTFYYGNLTIKLSTSLIVKFLYLNKKVVGLALAKIHYRSLPVTIKKLIPTPRGCVTRCISHESAYKILS